MYKLLYHFIVKSVRDKSAYFAKRLHESMAGFGTNDRALIRIVVTRCEIDMVEIKNAYMSMYGKSLEADIAVRIIFCLLYLSNFSWSRQLLNFFYHLFLFK